MNIGKTRFSKGWFNNSDHNRHNVSMNNEASCTQSAQ